MQFVIKCLHPFCLCGLTHGAPGALPCLICIQARARCHPLGLLPPTWCLLGAGAEATEAAPPAALHWTQQVRMYIVSLLKCERSLLNSGSNGRGLRYAVS